MIRTFRTSAICKTIFKRAKNELVPNFAESAGTLILRTARDLRSSMNLSEARYSSITATPHKIPLETLIKGVY